MSLSIHSLSIYKPVQTRPSPQEDVEEIEFESRSEISPPKKLIFSKLF